MRIIYLSFLNGEEEVFLLLLDYGLQYLRKNTPSKSKFIYKKIKTKRDQTAQQQNTKLEEINISYFSTLSLTLIAINFLLINSYSQQLW